MPPNVLYFNADTMRFIRPDIAFCKVLIVVIYCFLRSALEEQVLARLGTLLGIVSRSGPQLPKGCGCIGFLSPVHKKIPDSYLKREGGNPGNSGLLSQQ